MNQGESWKRQVEKCMILKVWVEIEGALSGKLMSESMWANSGQVPLMQSKLTQFMERVLLGEGGRWKADGAGDEAKQDVISVGVCFSLVPQELWPQSCTTELPHSEAKC